MALRSAPFLLLMVEVVALQHMCLDYSSYTLRYLHIVIIDPSQGQPHYVCLGYVNDQLFSYYDSNIKKVQPRVSWLEKLGKDDPQYWQTQTQISRDKEVRWRSHLQRYNEEQGVDMTQIVEDYALQGIERKRKSWLWEYDGNFMGRGHLFNEEEWLGWLEKYLSYGNDTLLRIEPPVVTVSSRMEVEDGMEMHVCRLDGFYPRKIDVSWRRDGQVWMEDTIYGSVAPNADGTYHYWLSIRIDPKERSRYQCHVKHKTWQEPLDVALTVPESNPMGLIIGCVVAGLVLVCAIVGILIYLRSHSSSQGSSRSI